MAATTTTLNDLLPSIVAEALFVANERSIMRGLVRNYTIPAGSGKTITVPRYPVVTAATITEGNEVSDSTVSTDGVTLTVTTAGVRTLVTDLARATAASNVVADVGRLFGEAIARKVDQDLLALFSGFSVGVGGASTTITAAIVMQAITKLRAAAVPGDALACVLHPNIAYDLKAALTTTGNVAFTGGAFGDIANEAMRAGYVGQLFGVPIFETSNMADTGTAGDYVGAVFHRDALGLAMVGDLMIETQRRASYLGDDIVASMHYAVGELYDTYGCKITADSSIVDPV